MQENTYILNVKKPEENTGTIRASSITAECKNCVVLQEFPR
jgi:hypothetical protein